MSRTPGVRLVRYPGPAELARAVAERFLDRADGKRLRVALSGGRIAEALFSCLASLARGRDLGRVDFFWADERCVPPADPRSNYRLACERLLDPLGIPMERRHPFATLAPPLERNANLMIERELGAEPQLDLVLLGMGEDGHVASLFPENLSRDRRSRLHCLEVDASKPPPRRITLGYPLLARAGEAWVAISGEGKEAALQKSLEKGGPTPLGHLLALRESARIDTDLPPLPGGGPS